MLELDFSSYTFKNGYRTTNRGMKRFYDYLSKLGYYTKDGIIIDEDPDGNMRIYAAVARFSCEEFMKRFERTKRMTLGNMCEIDIVEKQNRSD